MAVVCLEFIDAACIRRILHPMSSVWILLAVLANLLNVLFVMRRERRRAAAYRELVISAQHRCRGLEALQRGDSARAEMLVAAADEATDRAMHHLGIRQGDSGVAK